MTMTGAEWLRFCCEQLAAEWTTLPAVRKITRNNELYGSYVEASVREFIKRFVTPLRVSTGTIVYEGNMGEMAPQLDAVIWHPCPLPPIVESGEFAMVPRTSGLAYLEIKSGNYNARIGEDMAKKLASVDELVPMINGFDLAVQKTERCLGVICVHTKGQRDGQLDTLMEEKKVAVMVRRDSHDGDVRVDSSGVVRLAKFLMHVRLRGRYLDGAHSIRDPAELDRLPTMDYSPSTTSINDI